MCCVDAVAIQGRVAIDIMIILCLLLSSQLTQLNKHCMKIAINGEYKYRLITLSLTCIGKNQNDKSHEKCGEISGVPK